jgi:hypothetical protein
LKFTSASLFNDWQLGKQLATAHYTSSCVFAFTSCKELAKVTLTNLESAPKGAMNIFLSSSYFFQMEGRIECSACPYGTPTGIG